MYYILYILLSLKISSGANNFYSWDSNIFSTLHLFLKYCCWNVVTSKSFSVTTDNCPLSSKAVTIHPHTRQPTNLLSGLFVIEIFGCVATASNLCSVWVGNKSTRTKNTHLYLYNHVYKIYCLKYIKSQPNQ